MKYIEIKAPAKINLGLFILSKRLDGYHNLYTLFYPIHDLFDTLTFLKSVQLEFFYYGVPIPKDHNNLVYKAVKLIEEKIGKSLNVKITLEKRIPIQAGLGGGSSNAAATLISLNELFGLNFTYSQLLELALQLGSDVPFFVKALPSIGKSRGEILEAIELEIVNPILIVNPRINISTHKAFQNIIPSETNFNYQDIIINNNLDYEFMREKLINSFEPYIFAQYPEILDIKKKMYEMGALFALMSGSGSTVYGIFPNMDTAEIAKQNFPKDYFCWLNSPIR